MTSAQYVTGAGINGIRGNPVLQTAVFPACPEGKPLQSQKDIGIINHNPKHKTDSWLKVKPQQR